jgi:hypothetical protein
MATVEELEAQIKTLTESVGKELTRLRIQSIQNNTRLEALIRMMVQRQGIKFDDYIDFIDAYIKFTDAVENINELKNLSDKIEAAQKFNGDGSIIPIYADDLNVLPIIKSTGGISKVLHRALFTLPFTHRFANEVDSIIAAGETEEPTN